MENSVSHACSGFFHHNRRNVGGNESYLIHIITSNHFQDIRSRIRSRTRLNAIAVLLTRDGNLPIFWKTWDASSFQVFQESRVWRPHAVPEAACGSLSSRDQSTNPLSATHIYPTYATKPCPNSFAVVLSETS